MQSYAQIPIYKTTIMKAHNLQFVWNSNTYIVLLKV